MWVVCISRDSSQPSGRFAPDLEWSSLYACYPIRCSAQVARNILIQANVIDDHASAGDAGDLSLQHIFHLRRRYLAVQADDVVFDQDREICSTLELASRLQSFDQRVNLVQEFILGDEEVHHVNHAG